MPPAPPNIMLIIADDFGVHHLGCATPGSAGFFQTPQLDRLAAEGVRLARAYATAPACSPARASLYTGLHPARLHLTDFIPGSEVINPPLLAPAWQRGLPVAAVTLGDVLKARGYATAHFGKWQLAPDYNDRPGRPMDPESQGFDEVFVTRKPVPDADPETDPHHVHELTARTIDFVTRPRSQPFFCVLAHNAVHRPEIAPAGLVARYAARPGADAAVNRPVLAAMIDEIDRATGRLLDGLRAAGRDRDTLCWHYPHYHHLGLAPAGAIRMGDFKLIEWFEVALGAVGAIGPAVELFDLKADPGETRNLVYEMPERCVEMRSRLRVWRRSVGAQEMRLNPTYDPSAPTRLLPRAGDSAPARVP
ncbi:MAG: sulfatase-like hydrolase/transferase [Verrucomicrobia bacterium]|nr:sulfatase-like hydrolase/transferase [Verrucomicrobiota bacterium]